MISNILQDIPHKIIQLPAKAILLDAGNIATDIFFVKTGCLRAWFNADGKDITLQFFMPEHPVASFESLVNSTPSEYSIETLLPTEVVVVNGLDFKNWIDILIHNLFIYLHHYFLKFDFTLRFLC